MASVELPLPPQEARLIDATLACMGRWGVAKTTLDDVARRAGCSRATVYRVFPGGKESLLAATVRSEVLRFLATEAAALEGCEGLEDLLVTGMVTAARYLAGHEVLQCLLDNEPEVVLPLVAFTRMDAVYAVVRNFFAPYLAAHVGDDEAPRVAEWAARLTLSFALCPSQAFDVCDEQSVRRLVRGYVLPGLVSTASTMKG
ncbi:MAG: TetR/AcrR family transcriptional regulator [Actinobacteria bacterium]|nr:MAG: TetR/AcrR family transcriptional regulator [Actinomycetota bacterium]